MAYVAQQYLVWQDIQIPEYSVVPDAVPSDIVQGWVADGSVVDDPSRANIPVDAPPIAIPAVAPEPPR